LGAEGKRERGEWFAGRPETGRPKAGDGKGQLKRERLFVKQVIDNTTSTGTAGGTLLLFSPISVGMIC
jgi:hypothetical protein